MFIVKSLGVDWMEMDLSTYYYIVGDEYGTKIVEIFKISFFFACVPNQNVSSENYSV